MVLQEYFKNNIGDARTSETFWGIIRGIIVSSSLYCTRIGTAVNFNKDAELSGKKVRRLVSGESTKRSKLDEAAIMKRLLICTVDSIQENPDPEVWIAWDESEIRKPHATQMENLMKVRSLNGELVNGYRMIFGLAMMPGLRGIVQQHLFSSKEENFTSQNGIILDKIKEVIDAVLKTGKTIFHIFDRGYDNENHWHQIIQHEKNHILVRLKHLKRKIFLENKGNLEPSTISKAITEAKVIGKFSTKAKVKKDNQQNGRMQTCSVIVKAIRISVPSRQTYKLEKKSPDKFKKFSLMEIKIEGMKPCYLLTDVPVTGEEDAKKFMMMYMQRWAIEDNFKFLKQTIGYEDIQLMKLESCRTLLAMACVAAQYLYKTIPMLHWPEIQFLAKLGYWSGRKNRPPGKRAISEGIAKLREHMRTRDMLSDFLADGKELSPAFLAILEGGPN